MLIVIHRSMGFYIRSHDGSSLWCAVSVNARHMGFGCGEKRWWALDSSCESRLD